MQPGSCTSREWSLRWGVGCYPLPSILAENVRAPALSFHWTSTIDSLCDLEQVACFSKFPFLPVKPDEAAPPQGSREHE